ncbi:MAG: tetratricopeptide repeat protein [Leptolyngbyaceae cyanobacterium SM1_1_3]|nr:tetratricopeptide repeat protein [Leptolyngbyaceae cyanobacterium SM1_1_3]NJN02729.1 tetratricopeptide repeat protein [Leptolyngbyaceae cyanobacterium RM1_1_2]NJO11760.1 tetratricopeptide repeat protein [Leptolyngbyaceae cyanobacterium SL_1_1]
MGQPNQKSCSILLAILAGMLVASGPVRAVEIDEQLAIPAFNGTEGPARDIADQLVRLGSQQQLEGSYEQAINSWFQAIAIYQDLQDFSGMGLAYDYIGLAYARLGRFEAAEDALRRRLAVARDNADLQGQIFGWNNLGSLFLQRGYLGTARESFDQALTVAQSVRNFQGIGLSLSNLALIERSSGNLPEAAKLYESAANYRYQGNDLIGEANTLNSLGDVFLALEEDSSAVGAYRLALRSAREIGDRPLQLRALDGLFTIYLARGDRRDLTEVLDARVALTLDGSLEGSSDRPQQLITYRQLGQYYEDLGRFITAQEYYTQALAIARSLEEKQQEVFLTNSLIRLGEGLQNPE